MKKALAVMLTILSVNSFAFNDDATANFSADKVFTEKSVITWRRVDDVLGECNKENKRLGIRTFGYSVLACSFWDKERGVDVCTIITGKKTSMHTLGHEMRHCFQGQWH